MTTITRETLELAALAVGMQAVRMSDDGPRDWDGVALGGYDVPGEDGEPGAEVVCIYP